MCTKPHQTTVRQLHFHCLLERLAVGLHFDLECFQACAMASESRTSMPKGFLFRSNEPCQSVEIQFLFLGRIAEGKRIVSARSPQKPFSG